MQLLFKLFYVINLININKDNLCFKFITIKFYIYIIFLITYIEFYFFIIKLDSYLNNISK